MRAGRDIAPGVKPTHPCCSTLKRYSFSNCMQHGLVLRDVPYPKHTNSLDCGWTAFVLVQTAPDWSTVLRIFIWLSKCFSSGFNFPSWVNMIWRKTRNKDLKNCYFHLPFSVFFLLGSRKSMRMTHFSSHSHSSCQGCRSWRALTKQIWWGWAGTCSIPASHCSCGENPDWEPVTLMVMCKSEGCGQTSSSLPGRRKNSSRNPINFHQPRPLLPGVGSAS